MLVLVLVSAPLKPNDLIDQNRDAELEGHLVHYTNLLIGPVIPWRAFEGGFGRYRAKLRSEQLEEATRIEIELERAPSTGEDIGSVPRLPAHTQVESEETTKAILSFDPLLSGSTIERFLRDLRDILTKRSGGKPVVLEPVGGDMTP